MSKIEGPNTKKQNITTVFGGENIGLTRENQDDKETQAQSQLDSARGSELAGQINVFFEHHNIQAGPTVLPAVKLHFLREITTHPDADENELINQLKFLAERLEREESELAKPENPLPTIGIEIELPDKTFPVHLKTTLPHIGIHCEPENSRLFEINPKPTCNAKTQDEIINNFRVLGLAPRNPESPISLHINFGVPANINEGSLESAKNEVVLLSDLFIYAFTGAKRVLEKEIVRSFLFKRIAPIEKLTQAEIKKIQQSPFRVEFRTVEFGDYPTYRLLIESQRLMGMFFAHLEKKLGHVNISEVQQQLATLWEEFEKEMKQFLYEDKGIRPNLVDNNRVAAASIIENKPELQKQCRALITKYSQQIQEKIGG